MNLFITPIDGCDKEVHTFPEGCNPKANVIARREFELVYNEDAV